MTDASTLPLGGKAYGSIPHLPGSRTGPSDHHLDLSLARRCTTRVRDAREVVLITEKLDGSCMAAARVGDAILALGRDGRLAARSAFPLKRLWAQWVAEREDRFRAVLRDGERLVGEWLALAHGTRYALPHEPFVAFDLMRGHERATWAELCARVRPGGFVTAGLVHQGSPLEPEVALARLGSGQHGALDAPEGAVWRVERAGRVAVIAKYVRPDKCDGALLPEKSGGAEVWNWHPERNSSHATAEGAGDKSP
jgi:hypothetical protein